MSSIRQTFFPGPMSPEALGLFHHPFAAGLSVLGILGRALIQLASVAELHI